MLAGVGILAALAALTVRSLDEPVSGDTSSVQDATCGVLTLATQGQARSAKVAFLDRAHEPIHDLARRASDAGHRAEAARLLEAKNVVESSTTGPDAADAERLVSATRDALRALGEPAAPCPEP